MVRGVEGGGQCTERDEPRRGRASHVEREANDFATEPLIPQALGAAYGVATRPLIDDGDRLARVSKASAVRSAIRSFELSTAPWAAAMVVAGKVRWATGSGAFPEKIVKGRPVAGSAATSNGDPTPRVAPAEAWGGAEPFVEQRMRLTSSAKQLFWITPAACAKEQKGFARIRWSDRDLAIPGRRSARTPKAPHWHPFFHAARRSLRGRYRRARPMPKRTPTRSMSRSRGAAEVTA